MKGNLNNVPSVNNLIDNCQTKLGDPRLTCWENLDKHLMTQVVPWVPYLFANVATILGPGVTNWSYDQFSDTTAYSQVAVKQA